MKFDFLIGDRHLGDRTIPITVSCDMITRLINYNTVFYVMEIDLFDVKCNVRQWIIRFLVFTYSMRTSFLNVFQNFIRKVLVTDDVLSSFGALELIEFQNKINQLYFYQYQEAALDRRREVMLTLGDSIIKHSDFYVGAAPSNKEMHLARFCFKENDENFVSEEVLQQELGDNYILPCSQLSYDTDRQAAKQRILERRFPERNNKTSIKMQAPEYVS